MTTGLIPGGGGGGLALGGDTTTGRDSSLVFCFLESEMDVGESSGSRFLLPWFNLEAVKLIRHLKFLPGVSSSLSLSPPSYDVK